MSLGIPIKTTKLDDLILNCIDVSDSYIKMEKENESLKSEVEDLKQQIESLNAELRDMEPI